MLFSRFSARRISQENQGPADFPAGKVSVLADVLPHGRANLTCIAAPVPVRSCAFPFRFVRQSRRIPACAGGTRLDFIQVFHWHAS